MPRDPEVFGQPVSPKSASTSRATSATARICGHSMPGTGSRSTRSSSGWSRSEASTGCGFRSMQPRLTTQASPAASRSTTSSAVRPDGKLSSTVSIQSGRDDGARFWKNGSPSAPCTNRFRIMGLPATPRSEEHTSELQSLAYLVCRLLLEKKKYQLTTLNLTYTKHIEDSLCTDLTIR